MNNFSTFDIDTVIMNFRDVVKILLQFEASTNVIDAKGSSPLHLAAWAGDAEIVRLILTQGPSVPNVNLAVCKILIHFH